ncbi:pentatricopeptide repeat-containing protein At2g26790, mitochondrial [Sorghum bicolor]|uniref:Pentacotripeptide-repeat region of PRORP domain-containing protein n=1 Tax=Sorghum bicolor TaxID=4558 RepID=C5YIF2_SORBI|nr:pentatricopeptide repeat-containing protein At2g26790, mitochondrial [Sorghum bicolor]XP_021320493.1 pentatricopeptide repeat-containing protein At2g26790, mitochondrial [Sorghum bicolor]XP_021320494.1 pentatricopeptide repeat-containing protein At2g26790, mitochondrial [Sorghum bicolor]XP_021320495.1 pentatricopeptide repeat-containing protein At2g26790, mitochondrial [Sorghum bicolor]XP_021320496.1 pentatricopeptide repeat-containing protein At2g26790, mitochondrial [Sorghum bicolor]XP_02|eukprot:XP_002444001.1 pentatricopeptide repeat-containing protein At2g26790, mitochondrial [Sorghum bicolor]
MILSRWPKYTAEWFRHRKVFPWEVPSCPYSVLAASVQRDDSSGDERLSCAPFNEPIRKRQQSLSSDSVVQALRCLRRKPAVAFAYFKDINSLGFHHDFSTYSEIIQILSHSFQGKMLVALFCEILSSTGNGGPEILTLIDHLSKTCATSHVLSYAVNCLIKAYTTSHDAQETVEMFCHLCRLGFVPTLWACNFLLKFVSQSGDSDMVVRAYDRMKCFQLTLDTQSLNIVTRSFFEANKADEAFQVWVRMIEMGVKPDVHGYSSFIIGLCECGKYDLAYNMVSRYAVLHEIIQERVAVESIAYNMVIDGLCKEMKLEEAEKVLEIKTRHGSTPDLYGYSYLIRTYCKTGNLGKAWHHIEAMVSHGIEINCYIVGYLLQCLKKLGMVSEVIVYFQKFRDLGLHLDGVLYNITMDAYCKLGNMNEAVKLLNEMMAGGLVPDKIHYTCLINGYCLKGETENAWQVFEQMLKANIKPDVVTYNILASGYSRNGAVIKVYDLLEHMVDQGLEPNSLTYGVAIACFCREGNLSEAEVLFNILEEKGIDNIEVLYSSMVCGYLYSGWTDHAYTLFLRVAKQGNMVDNLSCSKLINSLCIDKKVEEASTVCSMMLEKNAVPDVISYSKLISAYCQKRDMHNAHLWFLDMVDRGLSDVIVYTVLMNGYCKVGRLQEACDLFVQMINLGIKPDVVAYTVLLDGHIKEALHQGWQGIAKEWRSFRLRTKHKTLLSSMKDMEIEPDVTCYTVLIDGHCKTEYLDEARGLFDEMLAKGLTPDVYAYTALINGYCSQGEIAKAEDLLQEMTDNGMKPDVLTFSVLHQRTLRHRKAHSYL